MKYRKKGKEARNQRHDHKNVCHSDIKRAHSSLVKIVPLSVTTISANPCIEKPLLNFCIVTAAVLELVLHTSLHLQWASPTTKNMCPSKGPA